MFEELTAGFTTLAHWMTAGVGQNELRAWIFIGVCVIAILMWAVAGLMELGTEFGVAALAGLIIAGNSGFFLGFVVFTLAFVSLFVVLGSVVGKWGIAADFLGSVVVGGAAALWLGQIFGLATFVAAFLLIGALLNRSERAPAPTPKSAQRA